MVRNDGTEALSVDGTTLEGADAAEFDIDSGAAPFVLTPGQSRDVVMSFNPIWLGPKSATLRIDSDDPDEDPFYLDLAGFGIASAPGGTSEFNPVADDFYPNGTGDDNHIKTQSNKTGYLKFDLSGVTGSVVSATLTCVTSQDKPGTTHSYGSEDDSWVEGGLTGHLSLGPQLDSATNSGKNQQVVWDVTSFVATQVPAAGGDGMATLVLNGPNQVYFKSREYDATATVLSITTSD